MKAKLQLSPNVEIVYLPSPWPARFTQIAFVISLALVVGRVTMTETLRDPMEVVPGPDLAPRGAGPTTSLVLDLFACVPALLVLLRRVVERKGYTLRGSVSMILLGALALWMLLSGRWAADKFAAIVTSFHFVAAAALLWSTSQLVRSWMRLRMVAGVCFGLLLVYCAHGMIHKFVDVPDNIRYWNEHKSEELARRGWQPESFEAKQFEKNLVGGAMIGFSFSPNTYAAVIVMLSAIAAGVIIQRFENRDEPGWWIFLAAAYFPAILILWLTGSKTALVTLFIAGAMLFAIWKLRPWLARQARAAYYCGVGAVIFVMLAVIGHGLVRGSLPGASLNFRWQYWIGAAKVFAEHPIIGVGWSNFGNYYLAHRLPVASEEIRDPHNFLIRGFVELGIIGAALMIAWLARMWWELTRPIIPPPAPSESRSKSSLASQLGLLAAIAAAGIGLNLLCAVDWSPRPDQGAFLLIEVSRRLLFLGLLFIGLVVVTLRSLKVQELDGRPAPWILYAILVGLGVFLIHNLVDFSLAEPGPLMLFALIAGAALGARTPLTNAPSRRTAAIISFAIALLSWVGIALSVVIPVADAEEQARAGDEEIRGNRPERAASTFASAFRHLPVNSDYAYRSARALYMSQAPVDKTRAQLSTATAANPVHPQYWLTLAALEMSQTPPDAARVIDAYEHASKIDPNNVAARIDYGDALQRLNRPAGANEQFKRALELNEQLERENPKRLSSKRVEEIRGKLTTSTTKP